MRADEQARALYHHGFRLTGDRWLAEDVVSTTFLQAWRMRVRIDPDGGSLRPWLLGRGPAGTVTGSTAIEGRGVVDAPGQLPG